MTKRVAVTGATGFIGRHLVPRCLKEGWSVAVLSREAKKAQQISPELEVFVGDLTDSRTDLSGFVHDRDVIIHCAGEIKEKARMRELHVGGCQRLIAAAAGSIPHWLQLSSVGVYGQQQIGRVTEEFIQAPIGIYEESKAQADALVLEATRQGAFESTIIRPSTVYGPDMPNQSLRSLIRAIQRGLFFFIGPPGAQAVYIHVEDVVTSMLACIVDPRARNRDYIVSAQCTFEEFVRVVRNLEGRTPVKKRMPLTLAKLIAIFGDRIPGFPLTRSRVDALTTRAVYDTSRIVRELGFRPTISISEGLHEMILEARARG